MDTATLFRAAVVEADETALASGIVPVSFASELPVKRRDRETGGYYWEVLSHAPGDCNLGFLNSDGVLLQDHDAARDLGSVVAGSARVDADRRTRCRVKIDSQIWRDKIAGGHLPGVSVGYSTLSVLRESVGKDGVPVKVFSWKPHEVSFLSPHHEPADGSVGIFRYKDMNTETTLDNLLQLALSGSRGGDGDFTRSALVENYSLTKAIKGWLYGGELSGIEKRVHESEVRAANKVAPGLLIRFENLLPRQRDMQSTLFASGGAAVQTDVLPFVDLMRNQICAIPLGAQVLQGLKGNFLDPRVTANSSSQSLTEIAAATTHDITTDASSYAPRRLTIGVTISNQLLMQTDGAAEDIIRAVFRRQIAVDMDRLILFGEGGPNEPTGIINVGGVGQATYGGAATWANVLTSEKSLADNNADVGSLGWAISPATRNKWKQASRIVATNYPSFIMEGGRVNDYPAIVTTSLSGTNQSVFGNWNECVILIWGNGLEIDIDRYTSASTGKTLLYATIFFNVFFRHPQSFCVSTDTAAA